MRCRYTHELNTAENAANDPRLAKHLAVCGECRAEADALAQMTGALAGLPAVEAPNTVQTAFSTLAAATDGRALSCDETLDLLEAWRMGDVSGVQAFLVEDHLLGCSACSLALAQADAVTAALQGLVELEAPAAIAERIAAARQPWWQRLLPPVPSITWHRPLGLAGAMAALSVAVLCGVLINRHPQDRVAHLPQVQIENVIIDTEPQVRVVPVAPARGEAGAKTERAPVETHAVDHMARPDAGRLQVRRQPARVQPAERIAPAQGRPAVVANVPKAAVETAHPANGGAPAPVENWSWPENAAPATVETPAEAPSYVASAEQEMLKQRHADRMAEIEASISAAPVEVKVASVPTRAGIAPSSAVYMPDAREAWNSTNRVPLDAPNGRIEHTPSGAGGVTGGNTDVRLFNVQL